MDIFEKVSRMRLRFASEKGLLTVEDLWERTPQQLNKLAKTLNKEIEATAEKDYLVQASTADTKAKLGFDIVLHILETKVAEADAQKNARVKKAEKDKLYALLERKQDAAKENLTENEIKQKIAELG